MRLWGWQMGREAGDKSLDWSTVRLVLSDFDGVMTDNRVTVNQEGVESVVCHRGDGWGIARLRERGITFVVVSTEPNPVVLRRCEKLQVECHHGIRNKREAVRTIIGRGQDTPAGTVFIGNDLNDLGAMDEVGIAVAVADSHPDVIAAADYVTKRRGGDGAVREVAELIVDCRPAWETKGG